jgi:phosphatidylserine/phosphatidylglycerophosphate/cardiolipin synthase-like enzyme
MGPAPVHDVSGRFEGPAAQGAHQFCQKLWETATNKIHLIDGNFTTSEPNTPSPKMIPASPVGGAEMLSLGRLGTGVAHTFSFSTNAGVTGRIVALCRAKRTIRISQQSLMGFKLPGLLPYDFYTCLAIVRAVRAGVDVQIVLSNELQNYGGSAKQVLRHLQKMYLADLDQTTDQFKKAPVRENIDAWVSLAAGQEALGGEIKNVNFRDPRCSEFNKKLKLATLYYADNQMRWKVGSGWKAAGNHSKLYICDDDAFYVGSDNFYVSLDRGGLQEFGYLVEDQVETGKLISDYWNNLWKYSGPRALN